MTHTAGSVQGGVDLEVVPMLKPVEHGRLQRLHVAEVPIEALTIHDSSHRSRSRSRPCSASSRASAYGRTPALVGCAGPRRARRPAPPLEHRAGPVVEGADLLARVREQVGLPARLPVRVGHADDEVDVVAGPARHVQFDVTASDLQRACDHLSTRRLHSGLGRSRNRL